jgi:glucokinase
VSKCLLADIGGTRTRFAIFEGARVGPVESMMTSDHASAIDAVRHFLSRQAEAGNIDGAVIGAAGAVEAGRCALTNAPWVIEAEELRRAFRLRTVDIVNDLEALAWATPHLAACDVQGIGGGAEIAAQPVAVIAPGTGLGMACFLPGGEGQRVLPSEGGHATLAATDAWGAEIIEALRRRYGHVSAERALSGGGLINLHAALGELAGAGPDGLTAERIVQAALEGGSLRAKQALDTFCSFLGSVAGDMALMYKASGGVLIAGGIVPKIVDYVRRSDFRVRFEDKGRFHRYVAGISTRVIVRPDPTFLGLKVLAERTAREGRQPSRQLS